MTAPEQPAPAEAVEHKSGLWLAFRVFDAPSDVFRHLASRPVALVPILCLVAVVFFQSFGIPTATLQKATQQAVERMEQQRGQPLPPEIKARMTDVGGVGKRAVRAVSGVVVALILLAIVAGVLKLIFGAGAAEPIPFKQEFAVTVHAFMASLLGLVVITAVMIATNRGTFTISLGPLVQSGYLHRFLNQVTVFGAWNVFLLALGNQILMRGKKIGGPLLIIGGLWLALDAVIAAFGGLLGM